MRQWRRKYSKDSEALKNQIGFRKKIGLEEEVERLDKERMEGKSGSGTGGRGRTPGKFSKKDDHQSAAVNAKDRKSIADEKRKFCSSADCKTFLGEADRSRRCSKDLRTEKEGALKPETTTKYLQDSYNNAFQKHVDNLTNVISQQKKPNTSEKGKTEVHIHPTDNPKNVRNNTPKPLSKLEIKNDAGLSRKITFGSDEDDDEESDDPNMKTKKNAKKVNVLTEKLQEEHFFEELNEPNPMIVFNHVCTEEESEKISFQQIKASSRSPSPMLEIPKAKGCQKVTTRPPL